VKTLRTRLQYFFAIKNCSVAMALIFDGIFVVKNSPHTLQQTGWSLTFICTTMV